MTDNVNLRGNSGWDSGDWQFAMMVLGEIPGAHPSVKGYSLLPEDLLVQSGDGTWRKAAPGIMIGGFVLTAEQEADLRLVRFRSDHLSYEVHPEDVL